MAWAKLMRTLLGWALRLVLMALLAALVVGFLKRDELARLWAVNTLFDQDRIVDNFSHMDRAFLSAPLTSKAGTPLPMGPKTALPDGMEDWMAERRVTSMVVLRNGAVTHESYYLGTEAGDLRIGWSLSKSFISALAGVVKAEGHIASLDDPVTQYVPQLAGGAYDRATVRHVLTMTTGVTFDEDYTDYNSDINRMGRILALGGRMDDYATGLTETFTTPGTDWQYVSIDTHVLGMVLRGATGRSVIDLMGEKIIAPLGLSAAPYYLTDGAGVAFALGGLNMTARDFARFGQMFAQGGRWEGTQVVPADWVLTSTTASAPTGPTEYGYGFQWWMPTDARPREYMGRGIYGQYLYINEEEQVVIALTAADPDFRDGTVQREHITWFRRIADG